MSNSQSNSSEPCVLVEGPRWGDAEFYGRWLLSAATANELLKQGKNDDPELLRAMDIIEVSRCLDYGIMGTVFVSQFADKEFETFTIETDSEDLIEFALMAEMGFFTLNGERYKMTVPPVLDMQTVKNAHLKLAETEDDVWIHPEQLVAVASRSNATNYQRLLRERRQVRFLH